MIRVLLADDQHMVRSALAMMIGLEEDIDVVAQAATCAEALRRAREVRPDVALLDVQMPSGDESPGAPQDGISLAALLAGELPRTRVVVLTTFGRPGYLRRTMDAGAVGFMVKDAPADRLVEGIRRAARGLRVVDPELAVASLALGPSPLSERETEVLRAVALGGGTDVVARRVHLSEGTVRNHLSSAIGKLGTTNRAEAVRLATEAGWI